MRRAYRFLFRFVDYTELDKDYQAQFVHQLSQVRASAQRELAAMTERLKQEVVRAAPFTCSSVCLCV